MRPTIALAAALLTAGCASLAPPPAPQDLIAGRLALQVAATATDPPRQLGGSFELRGDALRGQLDLVSPLGLTLAQARWEPGRVEMSDGGEPRVFATLEDFAAEAFGEPLPLAALFDWLRGRPWPGAPFAATAEGFEQLGWQVDTGRLAEGWLAARRSAPPAVTLRVRLEGRS